MIASVKLQSFSLHISELLKMLKTLANCSRKSTGIVTDVKIPGDYCSLFNLWRGATFVVTSGTTRPTEGICADVHARSDYRLPARGG